MKKVQLDRKRFEDLDHYFKLSRPESLDQLRLMLSTIDGPLLTQGLKRHRKILKEGYIFRRLIDPVIAVYEEEVDKRYASEETYS